jgi:hypothetical protein
MEPPCRTNCLRRMACICQEGATVLGLRIKPISVEVLGLRFKPISVEVSLRDIDNIARAWQIKSPELFTRGFYKSWHRAIFPGSHPPSIVAADRLYLRVRDGNGCVPVARAPRMFCNRTIIFLDGLAPFFQGCGTPYTVSRWFWHLFYLIPVP